MIHRRPGRATPALALLPGALLAAAMLLHPGHAAVAAPAARPAVGAGQLSIRIDTVSPAVPAEGDTLTIRGTITNTSQAPVSEVSAVLRVSARRLIARSDIGSVVAGRSSLTGQRVTDVRDPVPDGLAAGQAATFQLRVAVDELPLGPPGAYVIGAEALGDAGAGIQRQDLDRTFLPWWPRGSDVRPVEVALLWPISGRPVRDAGGILPDEQLAVDMSPAGRLSTLVTAAATRPGTMTWVVDPEVLEAASTMSQGYLVHSGGDVTVPGTRTAEVSQWLTEITGALSDPRSQAIGALYANPDVMAARGARLLTRALQPRVEIDEATREILGRSLPSALAHIPGGNLDDPTLARLARLGVGPVLLADWAFPPSSPTTFTPSGNLLVGTSSGDLPVLLADGGIGATLAMPARTPSEVTAMRQRLLAETLVTAVELPLTQRLLVAAPAPGWEPSPSGASAVLEAVGQSPWIQPVSVRSALRREPSSVARTHADYDAQQAAAELPRAHVRAVAAQMSGMTQYSQVLSADTDLPATTAHAPIRQLSAWFRERPEQRDALRRLVDDEVSAALGSVTVVSSGSITVSGASGTIPITVENAGELPVTVSLRLTSDPPVLFRADPVEAFDVAPARRTSVEVIAQLGAAGTIPVSIQLVTAAGDPFGPPAMLTVRPSAFANAARVLVQVALAGLALAVAVHGIRRARRARRRLAPTPTTSAGDAHDR